MDKNYISGYSIALFELAKDEGKLSKVKGDAQLLQEALLENRTYIDILASQKIAFNEKQKMLKNAFSDVWINLLNFILLAIKKSKRRIIVNVLEKLISSINKHLSLHEGIIYSKVLLDKKEILSMEKKVSKQLGYQVKLKNKIDQNITAGFKVSINGTLIEDTIASRFENLKNILIKGGN